MTRAYSRLVLISVLLMVLVSSAETVCGREAQADGSKPDIEITADGRIQISPEGHVEERLVIAGTVSSRLMKMARSESVRLTGWPVAPGDRRTVRLTRISVYAPGATILEVGDHGVRRVLRSKNRYFAGEIEGEAGSGVLVILDPARGSLRGLAVAGGLTYDLVPVEGGHPTEVRVVATHERVAGADVHWACGEQNLAPSPVLPDISNGLKKGPAAKAGGMLQAVLAIETDTELMSQKFGGSTSAAADYIADLIAAMNVMYARDLGVTLVQGTTFLRTSSDPYDVNSGGSASNGELSEFRSYWISNYGGVQRALAAMLSGKSTSPYSASGIAYIGSLCSTSTGYSFSKVFRFNYLSGDAGLVGHEIGHNFGSHHTHCYSPPIDTCWNACGYTGATSCPGGPGTVMSYCHLNGCGSNLLEFHSRVIEKILDNHVEPATGVCIFAAESADEVFTDGFEAGDTGAWSSSSQ